MLLRSTAKKLWIPSTGVRSGPASGGGGGGFTFNKTDRVLRSVGNITDSFSITIGTGTVIIGTSGAVAITSMTLGGTSMVQRIKTASGSNGTDVQIWSAAGMSAGTVTLVINAAWLPLYEVAAAVMTGAAASPGTGVVQEEMIGGTNLALGPLNIPAGGTGIVVWNQGDGTGSDTNSNLIIDYNTAASSAHVCGLAHTTGVSGPTVPVGITTSGLNVYAGVSLPWGP